MRSVAADGADRTGRSTIPATRQLRRLSWRARDGRSRRRARRRQTPAPWTVAGTITASDERLTRWIVPRARRPRRAAPRRPSPPANQFLAAGAPWFFTLFGRDSIWAARFMLPLGTDIAADTLRVLAGLQGTRRRTETAEEPGKIMHELRRGARHPGRGHPPAAAVLRHGRRDPAVDLPAARRLAVGHARRRGARAAAAPRARRSSGCATTATPTATGCSSTSTKPDTGSRNQGWKDSGDSVQWRDGTLATGPIALCEVQAYAYEAAMHGADLLDAFGGDGATVAGVGRPAARRVPRAVLDRGRRRRLPAHRPRRRQASRRHRHEQPRPPARHRHARRAAGRAHRRRLVSPELRLRVRPAHDVHGLGRLLAAELPRRAASGRTTPRSRSRGCARRLRDEADQLVAGAACRGIRRSITGCPSCTPGMRPPLALPVPYPAACRPQAWSAAAAIVVWDALRPRAAPRSHPSP